MSASNSNIALSPEDWYRAPWRNLPPLGYPEAPEWDHQDGLARLARLKESDTRQIYGWASARVPLHASTAEAQFWLGAMIHLAEGHGPARVTEQMSSNDVRQRPEELAVRAPEYRRAFPPEIWLPLVSLLGPREATRIVCELDRRFVDCSGWWMYDVRSKALANHSSGFRKFVRPYVDGQVLQELRDDLEVTVRAVPWDLTDAKPAPLCYLIAAAVGCVPALERVVATAVPVSKPSEYALSAVFGLPEREQVVEQARRLKLRPTFTDDVRGWLSHTGLSSLEWVRDAIRTEKRRVVAVAVARGLALVQDPAVAPLFLDLIRRSQVPEIGTAWFDRHPQQAILGLVPVAQGRGAPAASAAEELQRLARKGHAGLIEKTLASSPRGAGSIAAIFHDTEEPRSNSRAAEVPDWFLSSAPDISKWKTPGWLDPAGLNPISAEGQPLGEREVRQVLCALEASTLEVPHPLVARLRGYATPESLDRFALSLCESWQRGGKARREQWALGSMGLLGADLCALALGPLAYTCREQQFFSQAGLALDCLRAIGSETALLELSAITQISRDWNIKEIAANHLLEVAREQGLSADQLEDRIVPRCGFDARQSCALNFGSRQFRVLLDRRLKAQLREPNGKLRNDIPRAQDGDDPKLVAAATERWALLKKQLPIIAKRQVPRLEASMIYGRRWSPEEFRRFLADHPIMSVLIHPLVWCAYADDGQPLATFRLAEDGSLADREDSSFPIPDGCRSVGIPHPLSLSKEVAAAWAERMSDYELIPPFPQLSRPVYRLDAHEQDAGILSRFNQIPCLAVALTDGLRKRGWERDEIEDGGYCGSSSRRFEPASIRAVVTYEPGVYVGDPANSEPQSITGVAFYSTSDEFGQPLPLRWVDPVVFSEVAMDLAAITARK